MRLVIETRNEFYDGWLAELLGIPLPDETDDQAVESGRETAAESGEPCLLLQALRLELSPGTRNIRASYLVEGELIEKVLPLVSRSVHQGS